jgi:hypothetical protein
MTEPSIARAATTRRPSAMNPVHKSNASKPAGPRPSGARAVSVRPHGPSPTWVELLGER